MQRYLLESKKISIYVICFYFVFYAIFLLSCKKSENTFRSKNLKQIKVLILYSSGNPNAIVPRISEKIDIDAITSPTPKFVNTAFVAKMIADYLRKEIPHVILKKIEEIKNAQEVLSADVILIGSATHFGIMDWQTKRFFDVILFSIYVHHKAKLKDKYIGCFTTCEVYPSGKDCVKSIYRALYDFNSKKLPSLIILDKMPQNEIEKRVAHFTKKLISKITK